MNPDALREKLLIVSGKGGVGKTALASAISLACAEHQKTILLTLDEHHREQAEGDSHGGHPNSPAREQILSTDLRSIATS